MENVNADPVTESTVTNEDEEFYENLEAPMFVDLTAPDLAQRDDGSWFCLKIGCDQNHEQIDPEALNKSFMLRVMAARSPNVRLHKALKRSNGRLNANCPHSAPAKQPRSRLFRLSTATEVPDKIENLKLKNHPILGLKSPLSRTKKKVLTKIEEKDATSTPKNQHMISKNQLTSGGKNGSAFFSAKPLFSPTPKKEIKEVCANLRKLNLNSTKRRSVPSRYLGKVPNAAKRCDESKPNDSNLKQETEIAPRKNNSRSLWKIKELLEENVQKLGPDVIERDQNSELDPKKEGLRPTRKLRRSTIQKASIEQARTSGVEKKEIGEVLVLKPDITENVGANNTNMKQKLEMGPKRKSSRPLWKSNQPVLKSNIEDSTTSGTKNEEAVKEKGLKLKMKDNSGTGADKDGLKTELGNCGDITSGTKNEKVVKKEGLRSKIRDDTKTGVEKDYFRTESENCDENKENIVQNDSKRVEMRKKTKAEGKKSSLLRTIENVPPQQVQVLKLQKKPSQMNLEQGAKNKKTTNPKPFRFRTDERGILKEANLEKKRHVQSEPPKEESKSVMRKDTGTERCKGRIIPSKIQCLNKKPTSLASKRKNAPSLCKKKTRGH